MFARWISGLPNTFNSRCDIVWTHWARMLASSRVTLSVDRRCVHGQPISTFRMTAPPRSSSPSALFGYSNPSSGAGRSRRTVAASLLSVRRRIFFKMRELGRCRSMARLSSQVSKLPPAARYKGIRAPSSGTISPRRIFATGSFPLNRYPLYSMIRSLSVPTFCPDKCLQAAPCCHY